MRYEQDLAEFIPIAHGARLIQERSGLSEDEARNDIVAALRAHDRDLKARFWSRSRGERHECRLNNLVWELLDNLTPDLVDWERSIARRWGGGHQFAVEIEVSRADVCRLCLALGGAEDRNDNRPEDTPLYLAFMAKATREMGLKLGIRTPKKTIEGWLRENWPPQLGEPSNRKIKNIATLLRHPKDERGGHFSPERDK